ncbi:MAG TPA: tRNA (adenine-N(6)-)-methyltransferase, partial [Flavobacteriaceae bacterium]|nr:tRNA (adenine-N(6)-)-methyltransferase [Flavobacteriaceae bacterium]
MSAPFIFKEFSIEQDQCAMKIGTDGVLLGAWAPISHQPNSILDIGAGTGVVALMLAQRSLAETIDGVELI